MWGQQTGLGPQNPEEQYFFTQEASTHNTNTLKTCLLKIEIKILLRGSRRVHGIRNEVVEEDVQECTDGLKRAEKRLDADR